MLKMLLSLGWEGIGEGSECKLSETHKRHRFHVTLFSMVTIKLLLCKPSKKLAKGNKETENILRLLYTQDILAYF